MFNVPAACDRCSTIFGSGIVVSDATNITFTGNKSGPCPSCGGMGTVIDGTFDFVGNALKVVAAPPETLAVLKRLQMAIRVVSEASTTAEAAQKAAEILPEAKEKIEGSAAGGKTAIIALLIGLMTSCSNTLKVEGKIDLNQAFTQITEKLAPARLPGSEIPLSPQQTNTHQHTGLAKNPGQTTNRDGSTPRQ